MTQQEVDNICVGDLFRDKEHTWKFVGTDIKNKQRHFVLVEGRGRRNRGMLVYHDSAFLEGFLMPVK